jgi:hypothetical protein
VSFKRSLVRNFTGAGYFKALLGAGVCSNFWHFYLFTFTPLPASRTDGNLWSHVGNMFYKKSGSAKTQNAEWGAKVRILFEKNI